MSENNSIKRLLDSMGSHRSVLMGLIRGCISPLSTPEVSTLVDELQQFHASVFDAPNLCRMLEETGALTKVTEVGTSWYEEVAPIETTRDDGSTFLELPEQPPLFWKATEEGIAVVEKYNAGKAFWTMLEEEPHYRPIYKRLLETCEASQGSSTDTLATKINNDPLLQQPRYYASRFIERLEKQELIEWRGRWYITSLGQDILKTL